MDYLDSRTIVFAVAWLLLGGMMLLPVREQSSARPPRGVRLLDRPKRHD